MPTTLWTGVPNIGPDTPTVRYRRLIGHDKAQAILKDNHRLKNHPYMKLPDEQSPYQAGNWLTIWSNTEDGLRQVRVFILKTFEPCTLSTVMLVQYYACIGGMHQTMILKVYDRRFADQEREDAGIGDWDLDIEWKFRRYVLSGKADKFINEDLPRSMDDEDSSPRLSVRETWSPVEKEAQVNWFVNKSYKDEVEAYSLLKDLQGKDIPQMYGTVMVSGTHPHSSHDFTTPDKFDEFTDVRGILLEYIPGVEIEHMRAHTPKEFDMPIFKDLMGIVDRVAERGVCNSDFKPWNTIVRPNHDGTFKVFVIDFGCCTFKRRYPNETEWRRMLYNSCAQDNFKCIWQMLFPGKSFISTPLYISIDSESEMANYFDAYSHRHRSSYSCCDGSDEECDMFRSKWVHRIDVYWRPQFRKHQLTGCRPCNGLEVMPEYGCPWMVKWWKDFEGLPDIEVVYNDYSMLRREKFPSEVNAMQLFKAQECIQYNSTKFNLRER